MMNDIEYKRLEDALTEYCPDDVCTKNLVYAIKSIMSGKALSDFEKETIEKAFKDMVVYSSMNIMFEVLKESYTKIRSTTKLVSRSSRSNTIRNSEPVCVADQNSIEFDIDINSIPKVEDIVGASRNDMYVENKSEIKESDDIDDINRFSTDASSITSEGFTSEPKFSFDVDY